MSTPGNQATLISELSLPELTDLVRRNWTVMRQTIAPNARQLFIVQGIGAGQGNTKIFNEIDTETYADDKSEGANSKKSKTGIGYNVTMTARTFSKEIDITLEMRNDNRYTEIGTYITNLAEFCTNRQELDLTHRFTFCSSTSYVDKNGETVDLTVGDGNPLIYSTHTLAFSSTTYSNRVTGDPIFSIGAYQAALLLSVSNIYNNFGEQRVMDFNTIITSNDPTTIYDVQVLLKSMAPSDAPNSGVVNPYRGGKKHIVLEYLASTASGAYDSTKRLWWFIGSIGNRMNGWQAYLGEWITPQLRTPAPGNNGEDIHNFNWTYATYCRYGIAIVTGKGLIGSLPTAS